MSAKAKGDPLAALLAGSRQGAASVEKGEFRLDWKRALDKVKRFQLTDPHRYVLELVQAAVAGGATRIDVATDADDVVMTFDGLQPTGDDLAHLFDYLFAQDAELNPLKQLALGINSALALEPRFVRLDVGDGETGNRLQLTEHADLSVTPLPADAPVDGVRVHVRDRLSWSVVADLFRSTSVEGRHLADSCIYAPIPVRLNGREQNRGLGGEQMWRHSFTSNQVRGELALPLAKSGEPSRIAVCMNGVVITDLDLTASAWCSAIGLIGWVDCGTLTRNASHSDIHQDDEYRRMIAVLFNEIKKLLLAFADDRLVKQPRDLSTRERDYLMLCCRALLRAQAHRKKGKDGKRIPLPAAADALLDLPLVAELAIRHPERGHLRPAWDWFMEHGQIDVASRRFELAHHELPDGWAPLLGPDWVIQAVFADKKDNADPKLAQIEEGMRNRRAREELRREPAFAPHEVLAAVPVDDHKRKVRGQLAMHAAIAGDIKALVDPRGIELPDDDGRVAVIFMHDGIPLGGRLVESSLRAGAALFECQDYRPNRDWTDVVINDAAKQAGDIIRAHVPRLVDAVVRSFNHLPPPKNLRETGSWAADPDQDDAVMRVIAADWEGDSLSRETRAQLDYLMAQRKITREESPALWSCALFYLIDGTPVSLDQISGRAPTPGFGAVKPADWRVCVEEPWGEGNPEGHPVLNVTQRQREALTRYLGRKLSDGGPTLIARRAYLRSQEELRARRAANLARAEIRRQAPALEPRNYEVIVDLELDQGVGQAGIPRLGTENQFVRYLVDGLPLRDQMLDGNFPLHAVVQSPAIEADPAFHEPVRGPATRAVELAIDAARPRLIAAFAESAVARTRSGAQLIWRWLHTVPVGKADLDAAVPDAVANLPLLATVTGERISLRELLDDANAHKNQFLCVQISPGRQRIERPIVVCGDERRKTLGKLLGVKTRDYTRALEKEIQVLDRMSRATRPARLGDPTILERDLVHDDFAGQVGIAAGPVKGGGWVDVLIDKVPLERRPLDYSSLPLIAVISSAKLKANKNWTHVIRNATWKRAEKLLRATADELVIDACRLAGERRLHSPGLRMALQTMAGSRFRGKPEAALEPTEAVDGALAGAPIWESVDHRDFVSLAEITEHWQRTAVVWLVAEGEGALAPGRVIVRGDPRTESALRDIFGKRVKDGRKTYERDRAAIARRASAPPIETRLVGALGIIDVEHEKEGLRLRGQIGVPLHSEQGGLNAVIGIDGRILTTINIDSPIPGHALIDSHGLEADADWNGIGNSQHLEIIREVLTAALWQSTRHIVADGLAEAGPDRDARRGLMRAALVAVLTGQGPRDLEESLTGAQVLRTVERQLVSLADLRARIAGGDKVYAVLDTSDEGVPRDGRLIVRAAKPLINALRGALGEALVQDDARWRRELEGQRRFRSLLPSQPGLEANTAAEMFVRSGTSEIVLGMVRPPVEPGYSDAADARSRLRLHIGNRPLVTVERDIHPTVEAWVNDDRLSPTNDFRDVVRDEVFNQVVAEIEGRVPELLARASAHWSTDPTDATRLRLCRYALDHRDRLASAAPDSPDATLWRAPLWDCLLTGGRDRLSTAALVDAHTSGGLRIARDGAPVEPPERAIVVVLGPAEHQILDETIGMPGDYTETLMRLAARRGFLRRRTVGRVELPAVAADEALLGRESLAEPGWEGEIGLPAQPGRGIELHVFLEHRRFAMIEVPFFCRAIACVQWDQLKPTMHYDSLMRDRAYERLLHEVRAATGDAVIALAAALPGLAGTRARVTRTWLLDALSSAREAGADKRLIETLEQAPLLIDVNNQQWSIAALGEAAPDGAIAAVIPETAALGGNDDRIVLVIDNATWVPASRLLELARDDDRFLERAEGARRRESAKTSYKLPKGCIADDAISSPLFTGRLALQVPPVAGTVGIFSRGRQVETRELPNLIGLCGYIDGAIATDRRFVAAVLESSHTDELERLWRERLTAAVAIAAASSQNKRWRGLATYVQIFLLDHMDDIGSSRKRRHARVLAPDDDLPGPVKTALTLPVVQLNDERWVDLATASSGDAPQLVVHDSPVKRLPRPDARVVLGGDLELRLLRALLGSDRVLTLEQARSAAAEAKKRLEKKRQKAAEARARREVSAHTRTYSALKSLLRDVAAGSLNLSIIRDMQLVEQGRGDLVTVVDGGITVNADHPMWKKVVAAKLDDLPGVVSHLAAAIVSAIAHEELLLKPQQALIILGKLAAAHTPAE